MIEQIKVEIPEKNASSYPIWIGPHLLENIDLWMPKHKSRIVIITDTFVEKKYGAFLNQQLKNKNHNTLLLTFPKGEKSKTIRTKCKLEENMFESRCDRDSLIIALGGGVVGDLAGYIASTYMRGIDYIQMPTTLLSMVDSSVGGKTGINTPSGKNLIGSFWQPKAVVADIHCLQSLPKKELINGLIEAIKMFLTSDYQNLISFEKNLKAILNIEETSISQLIKNAVSIKAHIIEKDEKENGLRAILNFGHTIGHALEQVSQFGILHGYAVALGILVETKIAELLGILEKKDSYFIKTLFASLGITPAPLKQWDVDIVIQHTQIDKKSKGGVANYVLLQTLGAVYTGDNKFVHPVSDVVVKQAYLEVIKEFEDGR